MGKIEKLRMAVMAVSVVAVCGAADAQRLHHCQPRVMTFVTRPVVTVRVAARFTQKERFGMAMAYLKNNRYLTVKRYARMTGLSKVAAKAELDAFAADRSKPVEAVMRGKKKVYVMMDRNRGLNAWQENQ